jgi:hydroxymethylglutaryl-CoA synthase
VKAGDRLGIFAYGSGSCAQFYSAIVLPEAKQIAAQVGLQAQLDARRPLSMAEYEAVERERDAHVGVAEFTPNWTILGDWYDRFYRGKNLLVLRGISEYYRDYSWS